MKHQEEDNNTLQWRCNREIRGGFLCNLNVVLHKKV